MLRKLYKFVWTSIIGAQASTGRWLDKSNRGVEFFVEGSTADAGSTAIRSHHFGVGQKLSNQPTVYTSQP